MKTSELGFFGESKAIQAFVKNGIEVFIPAVDIYQTDIVAVINGEFKRFQVKSIFGKEDCPTAAFDFRRRSRINGTRDLVYDNVDYFIIYSLQHDYLGIVPFEECGNTLMIRFEGGNSKSNMAKDFEFDTVINKLNMHT